MNPRHLAAAALSGVLASFVGFTGAGAAVPDPPPGTGAFSASPTAAPAPAVRPTTRTAGGGNPLADNAVPIAVGVLLACAVALYRLPGDPGASIDDWVGPTSW